MQVEKKKPLLGDVLIVDGDQANCEVLQDFCKKMGCFRNILLSNDGSMASSKMRNQKFVLIILELKLPKKSTLDLIRELSDKSTNSKKSILIISEDIDQTSIEKLMILGVKNFLPKPIDEMVFNERVSKLLALK